MLAQSIPTVAQPISSMTKSLTQNRPLATCTKHNSTVSSSPSPSSFPAVASLPLHHLVAAHHLMPSVVLLRVATHTAAVRHPHITTEDTALAVPEGIARLMARLLDALDLARHRPADMRAVNVTDGTAAAAVLGVAVVVVVVVVVDDEGAILEAGVHHVGYALEVEATLLVVIVVRHHHDGLLVEVEEGKARLGEEAVLGGEGVQAIIAQEVGVGVGIGVVAGEDSVTKGDNLICITNQLCRISIRSRGSIPGCQKFYCM
jgi:hypothetical protein